MSSALLPSALETLVSEAKLLSFSPDDQARLDALRQSVTSYFTASKIKSLSPEEYFQGMGEKEGCLTYQLEWATKELGSIGSGSKYKFGYEKDFPAIKSLLSSIVEKRYTYEDLYKESGEITPEAIRLISESRQLKGLKTGRTSLGKLLSIYYPEIFIPIFTDQDYFLSKLLSSFESQNTGLRLFLENNHLLLKLRDELREKLLQSVAERVSNDFFAKLLYACFPKNQDGGDFQSGAQPYNALEVQHYQTLLHSNFQRLFPTLRYFDPDIQDAKNGHYDTQEVGILDYLAIAANNDLVVIELKRTASDQTLGQLLRYMGWIKENLCTDDQRVKGLILSDTQDPYITYAILCVENVELKTIRLDISIG